MAQTAPQPDSGFFRRMIQRWYQISAPPEPPTNAPFAERDRARRGHLASIALLSCMVILVLALPIGLTDPPSLIAMLCVMFICVAGILLNRRGYVATAGALLVAIFDIALAASILSAPHGQLDVTYVPLFDMFVLSVLFAVSILPPIWVFPVAAINSLFIFFDIRFQADRPDFAQLLMTGERYGIVIRPILLQFIAATMAFLWVQGTLHAIKRADQAEALAALEMREAIHQRELEQGVRELLAVYAQVANGNYHVRAPATRHTVLWQLNNAMNNLIGRLARLAHFEFDYRRTQEEAQRLVEAIQVQQSGRIPIWPAPSGTPLDPVIETLAHNTKASQSYPNTASGSGYDPTAPFASFANSWPARPRPHLFPTRSPGANTPLPPSPSDPSTQPGHPVQPGSEQQISRGRGRMSFTDNPDWYVWQEHPFTPPTAPEGQDTP